MEMRIKRWAIEVWNERSWLSITKSPHQNGTRNALLGFWTTTNVQRRTVARRQSGISHVGDMDIIH